jgi:hypothetical protein
VVYDLVVLAGCTVLDEPHVFILDSHWPFICSAGNTSWDSLVAIHHRLNVELDLQSFFGLLCTAVLIG